MLAIGVPSASYHPNPVPWTRSARNRGSTGRTKVMSMMNVKMLAGILAVVLSAGSASGAEPRTLQGAVDMMAVDAGVPARGPDMTLRSIKLMPGQVVAAN